MELIWRTINVRAFKSWTKMVAATKSVKYSASNTAFKRERSEEPSRGGVHLSLPERLKNCEDIGAD